MKKILLILSVVSLLYSCTENDGNENADPLLSGITFYQEDISPVRSYGGSYSNSLLVDGYYNTDLDYFIRLFDITYDTDTIKSLKKIADNVYSDTLYALSFNSSKCQMRISKYDKIQIGYREQKIVSYVFPYVEKYNYQGSYRSILIDQNGIYSNLFNPNGDIQRSSMDCIFKLDNYKLKTEELIRKYDEITKGDELCFANETYNYIRTDEEVILTNDDKKVYGKLNTTHMTLELTQIAPTKKNLGTFKLKEE